MLQDGVLGPRLLCLYFDIRSGSFQQDITSVVLGVIYCANIHFYFHIFDHIHQIYQFNNLSVLAILGTTAAESLDTVFANIRISLIFQHLSLSLRMSVITRMIHYGTHISIIKVSFRFSS